MAVEAILLTKGGENPVLAGGILVGCMALLLLAGYPLELALWGEGWWTCVQVGAALPHACVFRPSSAASTLWLVQPPSHSTAANVQPLAAGRAITSVSAAAPARLCPPCPRIRPHDA